MKSIKKKYKKLFIVSLVFVIIMLTSYKEIPLVRADDNYSTYLYNQNINVDNDKAHLLSENSDGSNGYRNIFQSNFLFPAKLNIDMLSTTQSSLFSSYSFNQFHFNNLDNEYVYASNDNSENIENSINIDNLDVNNGLLTNNGSLEYQDTNFDNSYYNSTVNFDDYQDYYDSGNYIGSYSFDNEINYFPINWSSTKENQFNVIDKHYNHNSVLKGISDGVSNSDCFQYFLNPQTIGIIDFWFNVPDTSKYVYIYIDGVVRIHSAFNNLQFTYNDYTQNNQTVMVNNQWYYISVKFDMNINKFTVYLDGNLFVDNQTTLKSSQNSVNSFQFRVHSLSGTIGFIDAIGYSWNNYAIGSNVFPKNFGNYSGSESFYNDVGKTKENIEFFETNVFSGTQFENMNSEVISNYKNHQSVLKIESTNNNGYSNAYRELYNIQESNLEISFWLNLNDTNSYSSIEIISDYYEQTSVIGIYDEKLYVYNTDGAKMEFKSVFYPNQWYYITYTQDGWTNQISLNSTTYSVCVNKLSGYFMNFINFTTYNAYTTFYIDGWINSRDTNMDINDNTNPYGVQSELTNNFISNVYSKGYGIEYYVNKTNKNYRNQLVINDLTEYDNFIAFSNFDTNQDYGIVYFTMKTNASSNYVCNFEVQGVGTTALRFYMTNGNFKYYDGSFHTIDNINAIANTDYNIRLNFNKDYSYWNCTINNEYASISDNVNFNYYSYDGLAFNNIAFRTEYGYKNYHYVLDNIDYSWTYGYYENLIDDLIPLDNIGYKSIKSINQEFNTYEIYPNEDIITNWYVNGATLHHDAVNDTGYGSQPFLYATSSLHNEIDCFGFENLDIGSDIITLINITFDIATWYNLGSNDMKVRLYDGNTYTDYQLIQHTSIIPTIEQINVSFYGFFNQEQINNLELEVVSPTNVYDTTYIYTILLTLYSSNEKINITHENFFNYSDNGKPVKFTMYYNLYSNIDVISNVLIYNYDLESYYSIRQYNIKNDLNTYTFEFNESAYFRFNKFKISFCTYSNTSHLLFIDMLKVNITYVFPNQLGYQELLIYNYKYDNTDTEVGYLLFEFQIYNNSIKYRYSEINYNTDDYIYSWQYVDTSHISDLKDIELQIHVRYGLNTLDVEIINILAIIDFNYDSDETIEFREQSRKEFEGYKLKSSFNYTSYTNNFLNLTGIIGNYSYACLNGMRSLYGSDSEIFHRYFDIPFFSQDIDVAIVLDLSDGSISNPSEPDLPTLYYWTYETFRTATYQNININIGNWTTTFTQMKSEQYTAKYPYEPESVHKSDLGSWKWKIKFTDSFSYTVDFNFMRNAVKTILNLILLFWQFVGYLGWSAGSYLLMFIGTQILIFIWNYLVYALFYAMIYVLWILYEGLFILINGLIWLYEVVIIPFIEWFWTIAFPYILDWFIIIWSWIIAYFIYAITLGNTKAEDIQPHIYDFLWLLADTLIEIIEIFLENIVWFLLYAVHYSILMFMIYLKYLYRKAKGNLQGALDIYATLEVMMLPLLFIYNLIKSLLESTPEV
jgi:hypothetical protein